jgi:hypothetical protein
MTGPKTASEKQLVANRANAQRSTGPSTPAGVARSRWNALTHGALAKSIIPFSLEPYESRQAFDDLLSVLCDELAPASAIEEMLVERIATSYWRLARLLRAEAAAIANRQENRAYDEAKQVGRDALDIARLSMPSLAGEVGTLSDAMDDNRKLRQLMTQKDPSLREVDDEQLFAAAQARLTALEEQLSAQQKHHEAAQRDQRSIPPLADAFQFARYETTLERQLYRALDALERLQRLRHGEDVPPPLRLSVDATITNPDSPEIEV